MRLPRNSWVYRCTHGYSSWVFEVRRESDRVSQVVARVGIGERTPDYFGLFTVVDLCAEVLESWLYLYALSMYQHMCNKISFNRFVRTSA